MKKLILISGIALSVACSQNQTSKNSSDQSSDSSASKTEQYFGEKITTDSAKPVAELIAMIGEKKEIKTKLVGEVVSVCQKKGCWMKLKAGTDESIRITFKDYGFFVPKDCTGKTAVVDGVASVEETSVAELKEYAKDAGKSKEEIDAIKEPKKELVFEAIGVILR